MGGDPEVVLEQVAEIGSEENVVLKEETIAGRAGQEALPCEGMADSARSVAPNDFAEGTGDQRDCIKFMVFG